MKRYKLITTEPIEEVSNIIDLITKELISSGKLTKNTALVTDILESEDGSTEFQLESPVLFDKTTLNKLAKLGKFSEVKEFDDFEELEVVETPEDKVLFRIYLLEGKKYLTTGEIPEGSELVSESTSLEGPLALFCDEPEDKEEIGEFKTFSDLTFKESELITFSDLMFTDTNEVRIDPDKVREVIKVLEELEKTGEPYDAKDVEKLVNFEVTDEDLKVYMRFFSNDSEEVNKGGYKRVPQEVKHLHENASKILSEAKNVSEEDKEWLNKILNEKVAGASTGYMGSFKKMSTLLKKYFDDKSEEVTEFFNKTLVVKVVCNKTNKEKYIKLPDNGSILEIMEKLSEVFPGCSFKGTTATEDTEVIDFKDLKEGVKYFDEVTEDPTPEPEVVETPTEEPTPEVVEENPTEELEDENKTEENEETPSEVVEYESPVETARKANMTEGSTLETFARLENNKYKK